MKLQIINTTIFFIFVNVCSPIFAHDWITFYNKDKAANEAEQKGDYQEAINLCNEIINMTIDSHIDNDSRIELKGNAYFRLGHYYLHAHSLPYDINKAIFNFEKAAEYKKSHAQAELYLSMIYNIERYGVKNLEKSYAWIERGSNRCPIMVYLLAEIYDHGQTSFWMNDTARLDTDGKLYVRQNVKLRTKTQLYFPNITKDKKKAYQLYSEYFDYNSCYLEPLGVDEYDIAVAFMDGTYLDRDYTKAIDHLRHFLPGVNESGADPISKFDERIADGFWRMSLLYRFGLGTIVDEIKAEKYLKCAAEFGSEKANKALNINDY